MIEIIILMVFVSFVILPCVGSVGMSYKDSWRMGNALAGILIYFCLVLFLVVASMMHLFEGSPSVIEIISKILKL